MKGKNKISNKIINAKKPIIIIGESALNSESGKYIFESIKNFLTKHNKINNNWNSLNILSQKASQVGAIDLGLYKITKNNNFEVLDKLHNHEFKIVYLLGADELNFNKKDEFIIYQGSHGDKGAIIADVIFPSAAYTEKNGFYVNLEGRIQEAFKATYPPGDAKEDWEIFNNLSLNISNKKIADSKKELQIKMIQSNISFSKLGQILYRYETN